MSEKRFDIIKPVENHTEELCCTECWQRGINWGSDGERERIIELIKGAPVSFDWFQPFVGTTTLLQQITGEQDGSI